MPFDFEFQSVIQIVREVPVSVKAEDHTIKTIHYFIAAHKMLQNQLVEFDDVTLLGSL
jgi:hypothetical protein